MSATSPLSQARRWKKHFEHKIVWITGASSGISFTIIIPGIINTDITAHALMGDGSRHGVVEQSFREGYPLEKAALKIIRAIALKKEEQFVGGKEGFTLWIYRLSPYFFTRFIRNHPLKRFRRLMQWLKGGKKLSLQRQ